MTFQLDQLANEKIDTGVQVIHLLKKAQRDIDKAFYFACAFEHPELIIAYVNAYLAIDKNG